MARRAVHARGRRLAAQGCARRVVFAHYKAGVQRIAAHASLHVFFVARRQVDRRERLQSFCAESCGCGPLSPQQPAVGGCRRKVWKEARVNFELNTGS